jgi:putative Mg2+ transporter-C (MgtC) family protein
MSQIWPAIVETLRLDLLLYLLVAVVLGGAVGFERERQGKAAGLRTNILICVGAALFTRLSIEMAGEVGDPGRIAAQIVTGVGFLGAGTILHARGHITGLTSAATIWMVAAIGMGVGAGMVLEAAGATLLVILVLSLLVKFERIIQPMGVVSLLRVEVGPEADRVREIEDIVRVAGLEIRELRSELKGDRQIVELEVAGPERLHQEVRTRLLRKAGAVTVSYEE